jgi:predicted membrane-bound mannosyltransferase
MSTIKSNWSFVGIAFGVLFALFSAVRYFLLWPDMDRAVVYIVIGGLVCAVSWLYDQQLQHSNDIRAMGDYLADNPREK